ncbi:unnamed protein product [Durusdinium trenchii]|uniref:Fe2OG dioxygenase domain-containing protein n=1 Tax=Durusdinium trenchii TaxID=1381693 RepID=A0ABP0N951_9DINO
MGQAAGMTKLTMLIQASNFLLGWSMAHSKVTMDELSTRPQKFCDQLKDRGVAIVQCNLQRRRAALDWLEAQEGNPSEAVEAAFCSGVARCEDVAFPRRLRRIDLVPDESRTTSGGTEVLGLAGDLHQVALSCLNAIAEHEELALEHLVAPERLNEAKEPSLLRANLYNSQDGGAGGPCWHVDLGLLTVMPVGSWPAMMVSPFHSNVGENAFVEELLDAESDVLVFAGTALAIATAGLYTALVHGVSAARLRRGLRISLPYFLRVRRGGIIEPPAAVTNTPLACLYPAAVQPGVAEPPMLDLLRFHRDYYGRLCTRGQVVSVGELAENPALAEQVRSNFYTDSSSGS